MRFFARKSSLFFAIAFAASGCADGPLSTLNGVNPYYRKQWDQDERAGPTFPTQLSELRAIRRNPTGLSPEEQRRLIPTLADIVQNSTNAILRAEATLALAEFPLPEAIPALQLALHDEEAEVRIAACKAWGRRGGSQALELLSQTISNDSDLDVRVAATAELGSFQDQQAVQALAVALNDKDPALQHRAVQSLKSVSGQNYGDSVPAWRDFVEGRSPAPPEAPTIAERLRALRFF